MSMTVQDLLEALEGLDPTTPVQVAIQPSHPLTHQITSITHDQDGTITLRAFGEANYYQAS